MKTKLPFRVSALQEARELLAKAATPPPQPDRAAFTRMELVAVLGAVAILSAAALPMLAGTRNRSESILCANNLRQIGQAFRSWASDHGDLNPWWVDVRDGGLRNATGSISIPGGESLPAFMRNNAWFQFNFIQRELGSPRILACPNDHDRRVATSWGRGGDGLQNSQNMNRSVSYTVGLHPPFDALRAVLSTDRNMESDGEDSNCSVGVGICRRIVMRDSGPNVGWSPSLPLHNLSGNVLFNDGSVEQLSSPGLRQALANNNGDSSQVLHFIYP